MARFGVNLGVQRWLGSSWVWATMLVNLLGCFLFGFLAVWLSAKVGGSPRAKLIILTGFLGAFTTFSTYAFEVVEQLQGGQWGGALGNIAAQTLVGIGAVFSGIWLARTCS